MKYYPEIFISEFDTRLKDSLRSLPSPNRRLTNIRPDFVYNREPIGQQFVLQYGKLYRIYGMRIESLYHLNSVPIETQVNDQVYNEFLTPPFIGMYIETTPVSSKKGFHQLEIDICENESEKSFWKNPNYQYDIPVPRKTRKIIEVYNVINILYGDKVYKILLADFELIKTTKNEY